ncbi:MAG: ABC transporter permease [Acidimicrobiia bacterium]|nr:ABC transporter permease [Acidimicrobiia bacterium]
MRAMVLVAGAVFRESVRDRVPYSMVMFAILLMAASYAISQLTAGQDMKIIKDLGLASMSVFGMLIAVFLGIGLVSKEVERKSIFALLAKPVTRTQFVLGKYLGLVATLVINLAVMTLAFYAVLAFMDLTAGPEKLVWPAPALDPRLLIAILLIIAEVAVVTAVALFFSTFSSPLLSALLTLGLWTAGHFGSDLRNFGTVVDSAPMIAIARVLYYVLPNLAPFDVKAEVVHGFPVAARHVAYTLAYGGLYAGVLLTAAVAIFRRRDFK